MVSNYANIIPCQPSRYHRQDFNIGIKIRAQVLTTIPDSTSQKFLLIGTLHKSEFAGDQRPHAAIFLDFASLRKEKCRDDQFEKWYARSGEGRECIMGHKVGSRLFLSYLTGMCADVS
jgi:hypothetical protein